MSKSRVPQAHSSVGDRKSPIDRSGRVALTSKLRRRSLHVVLVLAVAGCGDNIRSFYDEPTGPLPQQLSELGITKDSAPDQVFAYAPVYPLWSSGSDKTRFAFFPEPIDTTAPDAWQFPTGTTFFKTFAYGDRPIETRVVRLLETWSFDVYQWADDGSDAVLADLTRTIPVAIDAERTHTIPSRLDCRGCHESAPQPPLAFSELQLDDATLARLDERGLRTEINTAPERITDPDPTTAEVLGLFQGNCVHCHATGSGPNNSFDLRHQVALANIIDHPTESSASAAGIRVVPGDAAQSILWLAFARDRTNPEVKPMPPIGIDRVDDAGVELVRAWIEALPE
jgi:hypothetical protein